MKTNIILSILAFTFVISYNANAQLGNLCGGTLNPLSADYEIPLGGYNFNFTENSATPSLVNIGFPLCTPTAPIARLNVLNDALQAAGYFLTNYNSSIVVAGAAGVASNSSGDAVGLHGEATTPGGTYNAIGVNGQSTETTNVGLIHTGVNANAANGTWQSFAVNGDVKNSTSDYNFGHQTEIYNAKSTAYNYGFHGWVNTPGTANYGMLIDVSGATNNYGVYVTATPGSSGPTPLGPNYAGWFEGDVVINGYVSTYSDKNLKENIIPFTRANQILNDLNPVTFDYKQTNDYEKLYLPKEHQYGLIAQEVENVLPTFVKDVVSPTKYDTLGNETRASMTFKAVNYNGLIPILVQGHREQSVIIDSLETQVKTLNDRLTQLENCLSGALPYLCQLSHGLIQENSPQAQELIRQQLSVYLSSKESIVLDQNVPNPFAEQTVINFSIPESVKTAQIHFYDGRGNLIKTVDVRERGLGSLTVFGADLSSGTYLYSLVADGIVVASKKMIKE